jgi:pimeloyl-ACP methyl ester carboxylesterase
MLARALRLAQLAELAACLAAGAWLHAARGWGPLAIAAGTVAWFAGARLVLVLLTSGLGWVLRTPRAPQDALGLAATLRFVLAEWRALLAANLVELPWENVVLRADPRPAPTANVPVVLVHGYFANRGYFRLLVKRLEAQGIAPIFVPTAHAVTAPIEAFADGLRAHVERIVAGTGQPRVVLVGHSMGGLVARAYMARHGTARVARLVTLGSPHRGSLLARCGMGANARQMEPGSAFLEGLARDEAAAQSRVPVLAVYSRHDNMVLPQANGRLEGARMVAISGVGHIAMLRCALVARALVAELRETEAGPRT